LQIVDSRIPLFKNGLKIMQDAILHIEKHGHTEDDAEAYASGGSGF